MRQTTSEDSCSSNSSEGVTISVNTSSVSSTSWSVISGAGDLDRSTRAMRSVDEHLIRRGEKLVLLLTPPFDHSKPHPGYIMGYPPGVRENGGQYSHAALWAAMAFARLGDGARAVEILQMLNPIELSRGPEDYATYRTEPYAVAADVYSLKSQVGRGGWTWYTGSAAWMHRAGVESILGLRRRGQVLLIDPCIPKEWPGFEVTLLQGDARYRIRVDNAAGVCRGVASAEIDGAVVAARPVRIALTDDGMAHDVLVRLG